MFGPRVSSCEQLSRRELGRIAWGRAGSDAREFAAIQFRGRAPATSGNQAGFRGSRGSYR